MIFSSSICIADDQRVVGHVEPLPEERLSSPFNLKNLCAGVFISELQGGNIDLDNLNKLCNQAILLFPKFLEKQNLSVNISKPFNWEISLLKDSNCYRCLNDIEYRFKQRKFKNVYGYTSFSKRRMFVTNDIKSKNFNITFVHELFHSLSIYYGLFETHSPNTDEILARKFATYVLNQ